MITVLLTGNRDNLVQNSYQNRFAFATHAHTHSHTRILITFEDREKTGLKVDTSRLPDVMPLIVTILYPKNLRFQHCCFALYSLPGTWP